MLADLNFPRTAYFTGSFLNKVLQYTFAGRRCEDLLVPFVCTSTDILNFRARSHSEGPLWRVIRASMSLVGFVPPLPFQEIRAEDGCIQSSLLVDGGYTNQYPADQLRQLGVGTVICVRACPDFEPVSTDYGDSVLGGAVALFRRLRVPWRWYEGPDPPSQAEIQERLMFLPDAMRGAADAGADLLLCPPICGFGLLEFSRFRELERIGYEHALPDLSKWLNCGSAAARRARDIIEQADRLAPKQESSLARRFTEDPLTFSEASCATQLFLGQPMRRTQSVA
jgi:lysophospholipid hydrolase